MSADVEALRAWISNEHADLLTRFEQTVGAHVPLDFWRQPAGSGGASIAWLVYHATLHADLAVNAVLRGEATVISRARRRLGVGGYSLAFGLGEAEVPELTTALDLDALGDYLDTVHAGIQAWIEAAPGVTFAELEAPADGPGALTRIGVAEAEAPWLHRMWAGQPASFFLRWEAIGHRLNHLGEMVSVRNRLGLSPF